MSHNNDVQIMREWSDEAYTRMDDNSFRLTVEHLLQIDRTTDEDGARAQISRPHSLEAETLNISDIAMVVDGNDIDSLEESYDGPVEETANRGSINADIKPEKEVSRNDRDDSGYGDHENEDGNSPVGSASEGSPEYDGDKEHVREDEDGSGRNTMSESTISPSSEDSDLSPSIQSDSSESGSEYDPDSDSSSSGDDLRRERCLHYREQAPSPSSIHQSPPVDSPRHHLGSEISESSTHIPHYSLPDSPRRSPSRDSSMTPPIRSVYGSDGESVRAPGTPSELNNVNEEDDEIPHPHRYSLRVRSRVITYLDNLEEPVEDEHESMSGSPDEDPDAEPEENWTFSGDDAIGSPGTNSNTSSNGIAAFLSDERVGDAEEDGTSQVHEVSGDDSDEERWVGLQELNGEDEELPESSEIDRFTAEGDVIRERYGLFDYRDFGQGESAEERLRVGNLLRKMEWYDNAGKQPRKRLKTR